MRLKGRHFLLFAVLLWCHSSRGQSCTAGFTCPNPICGTLTVNFTNNSTSSDTYYWYFDDGFGPSSFSTDTNPTHTFPSTGTYNVVLIASRIGFASDTETVSITLANSPVLNVSSPPPTFCAGTTTFLTATYDANYTYLWQPGKWLDDSTTFNPQSTPFDTITYFVTVTDATTGCTATKSIQLSVTQCIKPKADFVIDPTICGNYDVTFHNRSKDAYTYTWNFDDPSSGASNSYSGTDTILTHSFSGPGDYFVELLAYDTNKTQADTLRILVQVGPIVSIDITQNDTTICQGNAVVLPTSGNTNVTWFPVTGLSASSGTVVTAAPTATTTYYAVALQNGCSDTDSVVITVTGPPAAYLRPDSFCTGTTYQFLGNGAIAGLTYFWDFGDGDTSTQETPTHLYAGPGSYLVKLTVSNGSCDSTSQETITVYPPPKAKYSYTPQTVLISNPKVTFLNQSSEGALFVWDFGDGTADTILNPIHFFQDTGSYLVKLVAKSANGCYDTTEQVIIVRPEFKYYLPSAFTPNNTGPVENEVFKPYFNDPLKKYHIQIYSYWGSLVFESFNQDEGWNGTCNNTPVPQGMYFYHMEFQKSSGGKEGVNGNVFLLR